MRDRPRQYGCVVCNGGFTSDVPPISDKFLNAIFNPSTLEIRGICTPCREKYDNGMVALVGIDPDKSKAPDGNVYPETAYYTGKIVHIRLRSWEKVTGIPLPLTSEGLPLPFMYMSAAGIDALIKDADASVDPANAKKKKRRVRTSKRRRGKPR